MFTIIGILGVVVSQPGEFESNVPPPVRDEKFEIQTGPAPTGFDGFETWMAKAARDRDGTVKAFGVKAFPPRNRRFGDGHNVEYPPLSKGDIVPLFGILRRVEAVSPPGGKKGGMVLIRLKEDELHSRFKVGSDSLVILLSDAEDSVVTRIHNHDVQVKGIRSDSDKDGPIADVQIRLRNKGRPDETVRAAVRSGQVLSIGTTGHRVRNVVAPDQAKHLVGWLELAPETMEK